MVQSIINFSEKEDRFINIYKAKNGIKSKNEALKKIVQEFEIYKRREELKEELDYLVKEHEKKYGKKTMSLEELEDLLE